MRKYKRWYNWRAPDGTESQYNLSHHHHPHRLFIAVNRYQPNAIDKWTGANDIQDKTTHHVHGRPSVFVNIIRLVVFMFSCFSGLPTTGTTGRHREMISGRRRDWQVPGVWIDSCGMYVYLGMCVGSGKDERTDGSSCFPLDGWPARRIWSHCRHTVTNNILNAVCVFGSHIVQ